MVLTPHLQKELPISTRAVVSTIDHDVSNTRTIASDVRSDFVNTRAIASDVHRNKLKGGEDTWVHDRAVSAIRTLPVTE